VPNLWDKKDRRIVARPSEIIRDAQTAIRRVVAVDGTDFTRIRCAPIASLKIRIYVPTSNNVRLPASAFASPQASY